jgi:hypothetical protein
MLADFMVGIGNHETPSGYYDAPGWKELTMSLNSLGLQKPIQFDSQDLELIHHRQFTQLLDKKIGQNWG